MKKLTKLSKALSFSIQSGTLTISQIVRHDSQSDFIKNSMKTIEDKYPLFTKAKYVLENSIKLNNGKPELMIFLSKKGKILFYAYTNDLPGLSFFTISISQPITKSSIETKIY